MAKSYFIGQTIELNPTGKYGAIEASFRGKTIHATQIYLAPGKGEHPIYANYYCGKGEAGGLLLSVKSYASAQLRVLDDLSAFYEFSQYSCDNANLRLEKEQTYPVLHPFVLEEEYFNGRQIILSLRYNNEYLCSFGPLDLIVTGPEPCLVSFSKGEGSLYTYVITCSRPSNLEYVFHSSSVYYPLRSMLWCNYNFQCAWKLLEDTFYLIISQNKSLIQVDFVDEDTVYEEETINLPKDNKRTIRCKYKSMQNSGFLRFTIDGRVMYVVNRLEPTTSCVSYKCPST